MRDDAARAALVRKETVVRAPYLCPEIQLHLVTEDCPLWRATDRDLEALALPAPYWAFAWAGGQALARYVLDHPEAVRGRRVLDFGAGGAVEGIAAMRAGAASVLAADVDPYAATCARLNAELNGVLLETTTEDLVGRRDRAWQVVLAGDVTYDDESARRVRSWLERLSGAGVRVLLAEPGRGFLDTGRMTPVATYQAPADVDADGRYLVETTIWAV